MQGGDVSALDEDIGAARLEVTRHQDAITGMATLAQLPPEIDRHEHDMGNLMGAMGTRMGGMTSHCSGSGMTAMHDGVGAITSEMRSYRDTLTAAPTLADARKECSAHARRVDGMLDEMEQSLATVGCSMMGR